MALSRRQFIKNFGFAGLLTVPILRQTRGFAEDFSPIYCQIFKPLGELNVGGRNMYYPNGGGTNFNFNGKNTESLNAVKDYLIVPRGLEVFDGGHGPGQQTLFTNSPVGRKGSGSNFQAYAATKGTSIDHLLADYLFERKQTRLKHFHFSACPRPDLGGTGYTTSYQGNEQFLVPTNDPFEMYRKIVNPIMDACGGSDPVPKTAAELRTKSVLDFHLSRIAEIKRALDLSITEQAKLDSYTDQLRDLEREVGSFDSFGSGVCPEFPTIDYRHDENKQEENEKFMRKRIRTMFDLTALAMEWELTNSASLMLGHGGDRTRYRDVLPGSGVFHGMSHKTNSPGEFSQISTFMWEEITRFLSDLKSRETLEGKNLLDAHCVLIAGGELSRPDDHSEKNMPLLVAGKANGALQTGRAFEVPANDNAHGRLLMSVCHAMGYKPERLGLHNNGRISSPLPIFA